MNFFISRKVVPIFSFFLINIAYMPQMAFAGFDTDDNDAKMIEDENTTDSTTFNLGDGK